MRNIYTSAVLQKLFDEADAVGMQTSAVLDASERNALQLYAEYSGGASSIAVMVWVLLKLIDEDEKKEVWAQVDEITIPAATPTANGSGPVITDADVSAVVQIPIPNCFAVRLELTTLTGGGTVTIWGATIEAPPAIA